MAVVVSFHTDRLSFTSLMRAPIVRTVAARVVAFAAVLCAPPSAGAQQARPAFQFAEATIADVHAAIRSRRMTCRAIVAGYFARIDAYDKRGPALNAIVLTNPNALAVADSLDRRFAASRAFAGPLH